MNQTILFFLSSKDQKASAYSLLPFGQEYMRPPHRFAWLREWPFLLRENCVIAWKWKNNCVIAWSWHVCVMRERSFWCAWWREKPFLICVIAWNRKKSVRDCVKLEKCDQFVWLRESWKIRAWLRENGEKFAWSRDWTPPWGGARICNIHDPVWTRHLLHFLYLFITQGHTLLKE